jgi:hypothetical protein
MRRSRRGAARRAGAGAIAALLVLLAPACGGGDEETGATSGAGAARLEKKEFVERANRICAQSLEKVVSAGVKMVKEFPEGDKGRFQAERSLVSSLVVPTLESEIAQLRELGPPPGDAAKFEAFLAATEAALAEAEEEPETYVTVSDEYRPGARHYGKAAKLATGYGLEGCPQG